MSDSQAAYKTIDIPLTSCGACYITEARLGRPLLRCGRCRMAGYCDKDCQKAHWVTHRSACRQSLKAFDSLRPKDSDPDESGSQNREECLVAMQSWAARNHTILAHFGPMSSGILPLKQPTGNFAPLIPVIHLSRAQDGSFKVVKVEFLQEEAICEGQPSLKGGFTYARKELKRTTPQTLGVVPIALVCDSLQTLSIYGIPASYQAQHCDLDPVVWAAILRADTSKDAAQGVQGEIIILRLARFGTDAVVEQMSKLYDSLRGTKDYNAKQG